MVKIHHLLKINTETTIIRQCTGFNYLKPTSSPYCSRLTSAQSFLSFNSATLTQGGENACILGVMTQR